MDTPLARLILAAHVLRALAAAGAVERVLTLDELVVLLHVDRAWVRATLSQLHVEGFVDVTTMRLSLDGFAFGRALAARRLAPLPTAAQAPAAVAA